MKKFFIVLGLSTLMSVFANAQDAEQTSSASSSTMGPAAGRVYGFGTIGFKSETPAGANAESQTEFTFSPGVGYCLKDNIALGGKLSYTSKSDDGGSSFGLGAFGRYFLMSDVLGARGGFFGEATLGFASTTPAGAGSESYTSFGLGVAPGVALYPSNKVGFEFTFPNVLGFYSNSDDGGSGFGLGASTVSSSSITFVYFFN